jgi:acyl-coenzyme A thioesterase PaaI-like protein
MDMSRTRDMPFAIALGAEPHGDPPRPVRAERPASERRTRHLQDNILIAFHRACDSGQLEVAAELLRLTEAVVKVEPDVKRRRQDIRALVAAHERLWLLTHPEHTSDLSD